MTQKSTKPCAICGACAEPIQNQWTAVKVMANVLYHCDVAKMASKIAPAIGLPFNEFPEGTSVLGFMFVDTTVTFCKPACLTLFYANQEKLIEALNTIKGIMSSIPENPESLVHLDKILFGLNRSSSSCQASVSNREQKLEETKDMSGVALHKVESSTGSNREQKLEEVEETERVVVSRSRDGVTSVETTKISGSEASCTVETPLVLNVKKPTYNIACGIAGLTNHHKKWMALKERTLRIEDKGDTMRLTLC